MQIVLLFVIFILGSEDSVMNFKSKYKYTISVNPLSFLIVSGRHIDFTVPIYIPGINFEALLGESNLSLNFELNNFFFVIPVELELGIREYLQERKEFQGFYLYQGIAIGFIIPTGASVILTGGYKSIKKSSFTIDPFVGIRIVIKPFFPLPALGLYLGYSW
jgi:hypothetical protein